MTISLGMKSVQVYYTQFQSFLLSKTMCFESKFQNLLVVYAYVLLLPLPGACQCVFFLHFLEELLLFSVTGRRALAARYAPSKYL